jgi:hypothetical protein
MICLRRRWTRRLRRSPVAAAALAAAGVNSPRLVGVKSTNFRTRPPPSLAGGPRSRFGCNDFRQNLGSRRSRLNLILTKILTSKTRARSPGQGGVVSCPRACGQAVDNPCPHSSPASHTLWGHARGCDLRNRTRSAVSCIGTCTIDPGSVAMYERCVGQTHAR